MRALIAALALAACSPPAPPAPVDDVITRPVDLGAGSIRLTETRNRDRTALTAAPVEGEWVFWGSEPQVSACFDTAGEECVLAIQCERPTGIVTLHYAHELTPDQWTSVRIITQRYVLDLPGQSINDDGAPRVDVRLADGTYERQIVLDHLAPAQERFAVDIWNEVQVFLWDDEIARALDACR